MTRYILILCIFLSACSVSSEESSSSSISDPLTSTQLLSAADNSLNSLLAQMTGVDSSAMSRYYLIENYSNGGDLSYMIVTLYALNSDNYAKQVSTYYNGTFLSTNNTTTYTLDNRLTELLIEGGDTALYTGEGGFDDILTATVQEGAFYNIYTSQYSSLSTYNSQTDPKIMHAVTVNGDTLTVYPAAEVTENGVTTTNIGETATVFTKY